MAVYYVDPIGGNDANAGTSFATRWQTFTNGATAARIAAGDTIRMIASPDPTSMAQNATWTDASPTVTLTTAVTANISQATAAWTPSTNVTSTTSAARKIGSTSSQIAIAAAFTTGKAAYLALGSAVDFSAYQQVSFWINMTAGAMANDGDITLRLCSDTTGDVTVNTISIPRIRATSTWQAYTVDLGTNLGASIQSIALYVAVDNAAQTFLINNILACKASSAADSLSLTSLISKNTTNEPWLGLQSINGTTLTLEFNPQFATAAFGAGRGGYYGTTATQTIYKREVLQLPSALVASTLASSGGQFNATKSGSAGSVITYSGGWNRTDMSTQTGDTYISGVNSGASGFYSTTFSYLTIEKINPTRFYNGFLLLGNAGSLTNCNVTASDVSNNTNAGINFSTTSFGFCYNNTATITNIQGNGNAAALASAGIYMAGGVFTNTVTAVNVNTNYVNGASIVSLGQTFSSGVPKTYSPYGNILNITNLARNICNANAGTAAGMVLDAVSNNIINLTNATSNQIGSINFTSGSSNNLITITNTLADGTSGGAYANIQILDGSNNTINLTGATCTCGNALAYNVLGHNASSNNKIINGTFAGTGTHFQLSDTATITAINPTVSAGTLYNVNTNAGGSITFGNYGNSTTDQRTYYSAIYGNILTDTSIRHTASGISWKMTSANTPAAGGPTSFYPLSLPVATIACNSGTLVTASVWVYRTSTSLTTNFVCPGGQIAGVSTTSTSASAAINTWEQLTITFTPSQQGVVQLFVQCYGANASVYVDDFTVSQA